jgi:membrane protease YdiL (CAAX protease family)
MRRVRRGRTLGEASDVPTDPEGQAMTISGTTARRQLEVEDPRSGVERPARAQLASVAWFAGLSLALAVVAFAAGTPAAMLPFILAIGPLLIALVITWREGGGAVRTLLRSATIRPADRRWYLVLLIPVAWSLATVAVAVGLGEPSAGLFTTLFPAVLIIPIVVLVPAFTEELAWRGFALPRLMSAMSPLKAALVLAIPWTLVHVFLYVPGQFNGTLSVWPMIISIFAYSIVLTWVYIGTGGSVLMTALLHAGLNGVAPVMAGVDPDNAWIIRNILAAVIAVAVIALGGLRRRAAAPRIS